MSMLEFDDGPHNDYNVRTIIEFIDNEFYDEAIKEQIYDRLDCNTVDYVEQFKMKVNEVMEKYDEADYHSIIIFEEQLCRNIISWIQECYNIEIDYDDDSLSQVSYEMYKFFVLELKLITESFLQNYIIENYKYILVGIPEENLNMQLVINLNITDLKDEYLTVTNINEIVKQVSYLEFDFETFVKYASMSGDIESLSQMDEDGTLSIAWNFLDESALVQTILNQIVNGEYDRNIVISITDNLIDLFNINLEEERK